MGHSFADGSVELSCFTPWGSDGRSAPFLEPTVWRGESYVETSLVKDWSDSNGQEL